MVTASVATLLPAVSPDPTLRATLARMLRSGVDTNPALAALIEDYTRFHLVLAVVGGGFLLALAVLSTVLWRRYRRSRRAEAGGSAFERRTYLAFAVLGTGLCLFLAVVVAANVSTVVAPLQGFGGSLPLLGAPRAGTARAELQQAVIGWLSSGSSGVPAQVRAHIEERLAWQRPKAVVTSALLLVVTPLCVVLWRTLIRRSRAQGQPRAAATLALLAAGVTTAGTCVLLMLMVMGNTQGSLAPLSLTLFLG